MCPNCGGKIDDSHRELFYEPDQDGYTMIFVCLGSEDLPAAQVTITVKQAAESVLELNQERS